MSSVNARQNTERLILFICTGNTCRSPMAEALFNHLRPADLRWRARSAGLSACQGERATAQALEATARQGIDLSAHRSRPLTAPLLEQADLLITMTQAQRRTLAAAYPAQALKVSLLRSFDPHAPAAAALEDPFCGDLETYLRCRDQIAAAIRGLLASLRR